MALNTAMNNVIIKRKDSDNMYDEYPDLIYEGLVHDFEYVTESSNKEGMMTKIKIFIKKLVNRIIVFFKKMKNKLTGKRDEDKYQSNSQGENESVKDYLKRIHKRIMLPTYSFNQVEHFITSECEKTLNELLEKYSDLIYWMMIQYDKKNYKLITEYYNEESEYKEYTEYCIKKIKNILIDTDDLQLVTEELYNNAFKMLKIMNNNHIDIVCNDTLVKLDKIDKEIERKKEKEKRRTDSEYIVYRQALSAMGGISYDTARVVKKYISEIDHMINDFNKIISVVDITKSPYNHDGDEV